MSYAPTQPKSGPYATNNEALMAAIAEILANHPGEGFSVFTAPDGTHTVDGPEFLTIGDRVGVTVADSPGQHYVW